MVAVGIIAVGREARKRQEHDDWQHESLGDTSRRVAPATGWDAPRGQAIRKDKEIDMPRSGAIALLSLCVACSGPGHVEGPLGTFELRSAWYRTSVNGTVVVLSNGELECGMPQLEDDLEQALAEDRLAVALCREGAQHVALRLYDTTTDPEAGQYAGLTVATEESVSEELPRVANGIYYAVSEAYLSGYDNLIRDYDPENEILWELGDGGQVIVDEPSAGELTGWFRFPYTREDSSVAGEFVAQECSGDTALLDLVEASDAPYYCSLL
jgi:hypothetical protein